MGGKIHFDYVMFKIHMKIPLNDVRNVVKYMNPIYKESSFFPGDKKFWVISRNIVYKITIKDKIKSESSKDFPELNLGTYHHRKTG